MKNFQPGGLRGRKPDLGGRPQSDVNSYAPKFRASNERSDNKPRFNDRNDRPIKKDVQLFAAKCTTCGKSCEVPFKPDGTKPVLCRDCFAAKNESPISRDRFTTSEMKGRTTDRTFAPRLNIPSVSPAEFAVVRKQLASMEVKISQLLELLTQPIPQSSDLTPTADTKNTTDSTDLLSVETKVRKPKKVSEAITKAASKKKVAKKTKVAKKIAKTKE